MKVAQSERVWERARESGSVYSSSEQLIYQQIVKAKKLRLPSQVRWHSNKLHVELIYWQTTRYPLLYLKPTHNSLNCSRLWSHFDWPSLQSLIKTKSAQFPLSVLFFLPSAACANICHIFYVLRKRREKKKKHCRKIRDFLWNLFAIRLS